MVLLVRLLSGLLRRVGPCPWPSLETVVTKINEILSNDLGEIVSRDKYNYKDHVAREDDYT